MLRSCGSATPAVTATLASRSPWINVLDGTGSFAAAAAGDTVVSGVDDFVVEILPGAPVEDPQNCSLSVAGGGYSDSLRIPLVIGDSVNLPAGPDAYGYRIYDRTDSGYVLPSYDWCEIRGSGRGVPLGDDETATLPIPPRFGAWRYYGLDHDSLSICSNGWVSAGTTARCDFVNVILPYVNAPPNMVALCWDNLNPAAGGAIWMAHDSVNDRLIIEFDSVPYFAPADKRESFQLQVHGRSVPTPTGDNALSLHLRTFNYYRTGTVGMQNRDGSAGLTHLWDVWYPRIAAQLGPQQSLLIQPAGPVAVGDHAGRQPQSQPVVLVQPNPFSAVTTLRFDSPLPGSSPVRVFDALGRHVSSITASPDGMTWSGRHLQGRLLPAGVYYAEVTGYQARVLVKLQIVR